MPKHTTFLLIAILTLSLLLGTNYVAFAQEIRPADESVQEEGGEPTADEEIALDETVEAEVLEVLEPTLLPDSPFYFFKDWRRGIRAFFTFNKVNKANLKAKYASEKLLEVRTLVEKVKDSEIIIKAVENYEKEVEKVKAAADKIKEKAEENPEVGKFLDKFTKHQVLHQRVLEELEEQVPEKALERIRETKENHLQKFGEVMQKLENKEKIQERLEKNLEELKGSEFKDFKNLDVLKRLEEKAPEQVKEAIRKTQENTLRRLKTNFELMSLEAQEKFKDYTGKIRGEAERKTEIIENLRLELIETPKLRESLEGAREQILENLPERIRMEQKDCPEWTAPAPGFCPNGRVIIEKSPEGCPLPAKCITTGEIIKPISVKPDISVCIALWDPVCGKDGETYSNKCFARQAGIEIAHQGRCKTEAKIEAKTETRIKAGAGAETGTKTRTETKTETKTESGAR